MNIRAKPRSALRKIVVVVAAVAVTVAAFATWYRFRYAMGVAQALDFPGAPGAPNVLIATQASAYKDAVTTGLIEHLKGRSVSVKVIDVSGLGLAQPAEWDAVVLMHTWEMSKPPEAVQAFVGRVRNARNLVVLTTSGQGDFRMEGVDAVTSASRMVDVPAHARELASRVDVILDRRAPKPSR